MPNCTPRHPRTDSRPDTASMDAAVFVGQGAPLDAARHNPAISSTRSDTKATTDTSPELASTSPTGNPKAAIDIRHIQNSTHVNNCGDVGGLEGGGTETSPSAAHPQYEAIENPHAPNHWRQKGDGGIGVNGSVWVTGQVCSRDQRKGRYVPESIYHPGKMLPSIARHVIAEYTAAGDIVADPMCGIGTTLIEVMHAGRIGIGVEYEQRWADLAHANIEYATSQDAPGTAQVWCGDGRQIAEFVPEDMRGKVALVMTSPPYGSSTHGRAYTGNRRIGRKVLKAHHKYGDNRDNLAYVQPDELATGFTQILTSCATMLRPGGIVAVTARPYRERGELVDVPGMVIAAGNAAGLTLVDRKVALLCGVRDGHLIPRGSFFQIQNVRLAAEEDSAPLHVIQHEDLMIFNVGFAAAEVTR